MLDYTSFVQEIYNLAVNEFKNAKVKIEDFQKNNGVKLKALIIMRNDLNVAPTIYLEGFYEEYKSGATLDDIFDGIISMNETYQMNRPINTDIFNDFENAKTRIIFTLVNTEQNLEWLDSIPHFDYYDLSIIFSICLRADDDMFVKTTISNALMEQWGVNADELRDLAMKNTPSLLGDSFMRMEDFLNSMAGEDIVPAFESSLYIVTNSLRTNGANVLLYPDYLQKLAERLESDLIILPSSIHEILILRFDDEMASPYELCDLVHEVNQTQVSRTEFLSNNVYLFKRESPEKLTVFVKGGKIWE